MTYFLITAMGGLCIFFSCTNLLPEKPAVSGQLILFVCIMVSSCLLNRQLGQYYAYITIAVALTVIYFSTSQRWMNLSCALFGYLFTIALNYLCIWVTQKLFGMTLEQIYQNNLVITLFSFVYSIICFLSTFMLGYWLNRKLKIPSLLADDELCFALFITTLLLSALFIFNFSYGDNIGYSYGVVAFNGILFLSLFIAVTILIWFLYRSIKQKQQAVSRLHQYESLQTYTNELEKLYYSLRSFKHDYVNILSTLSGYIEAADLAQLKEYFYKEIIPISQTFSESDNKLERLAFVEILEIKSLLSSKIIYAMTLAIKVDLELSEPITNIPIKTVDLARVLGVFFDNAIEAAVTADEKLIQFCFLRKENHLMIILRNRTLTPLMPLAKLTAPGISGKGLQRGMGLYNAKTILDSYNNVLWEMDYQDAFFTQTLIIYQTGDNDR